MSNTWNWTINDSTFEYAKTNAKARAKRQWDKWLVDRNSVNLWITQFSRQNPNWFDPWFENELDGVYNGVGDTAHPDSYESTQNAYFIYCWMKNKGYHDFCICVFLTIVFNECRFGMGAWEDQLAPWGFLNTRNPASLIDFPPTRTGESATNYDNNWHHGGSIIQQSVASAFDEVTHQTYHKNRVEGSWAAWKRWELDTYTDPDTGLERVTLDEQGNPVFYIPENGNRCVIGYGMVQWTNWTRLVRHANLTFPNYGNKHWQFNATLQLMTLEKERSIAMATPSSGQSSSDYDGEWRNTGAPNAYFTYNGVNYYYPYSCTWDNWALGNPMLWVESKCAELGITSESTITVYKLLILVDIFCRCYLHSGNAYHNNFSNLSNQRAYFLSAINYWNRNGGADIMDVPRPRDIPHTELDDLHINEYNKTVVILTGNNRRCKRVRTILL